MRLTKSLLFGIAALALTTGAAFAGQDSTEGSVETSPPELLSDESFGGMNDSYALDRSEGDVIYLYPMEVTEYYLVIPSQSSEFAG